MQSDTSHSVRCAVCLDLNNGLSIFLLHPKNVLLLGRKSPDCGANLHRRPLTTAKVYYSILKATYREKSSRSY